MPALASAARVIRRVNCDLGLHRSNGPIESQIKALPPLHPIAVIDPAPFAFGSRTIERSPTARVGVH
jgi:hypothetical protein